MPSLDEAVARLRDAGVARIFGVPGGGSVDLIDAAERNGVPFVLTATETAGALAAIAQAEISGRPGVCLTALGPGVASVVNGAACALLERAPLVVLTDGHPASGGGGFAHQFLDHRALLAPVTKGSAAIAGGPGAAATIDRAIALATAPPPGPVHVECAPDGAPVTDLPAVAGGARPDPGERTRALDAGLIGRSRRPLALVGLGARRREDVAAVRTLCARRGVPALVTYKAKGVVADSDPYFAGLLTNGAIEQPILEEADLLIAIGLDPVELVPRSWHHSVPVIGCGRWVVQERHLSFTAQIVGDIASSLERIGDLLPGAGWDLRAVARRVAENRRRICLPSGGLAPHRVVQTAAAAAGAARVTVDAGAHMFPATMLWPISEPTGMLISNGLSTMGFAVPAAIGAALLSRSGAPAPVIALTGDGGMLMSAGELATAAREQLHIVIIVLNDASLSLIDVKQRQRGHRSAGVDLGRIRWCPLAESFGVAASRVTSEAALERELAVALSRRAPALIEVVVDPSTYAETLRAVRG